MKKLTILLFLPLLVSCIAHRQPSYIKIPYIVGPHGRLEKIPNVLDSIKIGDIIWVITPVSPHFTY